MHRAKAKAKAQVLAPDLRMAAAIGALASILAFGAARAQDAPAVDRGLAPVEQGAATGAIGAGAGPITDQVMGVSLEAIRDAEVVGENREEIGEVQEIIRSSAGPHEGLFAVVNVDNGWFEEDTQIVVPIGRFTVLDDGTMMLAGVTEETIGEEFEEYEAARWAPVDYDRFATIGEAYEGYGWN